MFRLTIHTGLPGNYYFFHNRIKERVAKGFLDFIHILPVNRAVRLYKRRLISEAPGQAMMDPPVYTFDEFLMHCFRMLFPMTQVIGAEMSELLLEDILAQNPPFQFLKLRGTFPASALHRLTNMLSELRRYGYDLSAWQEVDADKIGIPPEKYEDFTLLLKQFDHRLAAGMIDEPFALHRAAAMLNENTLRRLWPGVASLYITGYELMTPAMLMTIKKLSQWMDVFVKLEYHPDNPDLFAQTRLLMAAFADMGAEVKQQSGDDLGKVLFNRQKNITSTALRLPTVHYLVAKDREAEVLSMAAAVKKLHTEEHIKLSEIGVTFSDLERYAPIVRKIFTRLQIPFNLSTGRATGQSPLIQQYIAVLDMIRQNFPARLVMRFLFALPTDAQPQGLMPLYRYLLANRFERLQPGWVSAIKKIIDSDHNLSREKRDGLLQTAEILKSKTTELYKLNQPLTVSEFQGAYLNVLKYFGLLEWYKEEPRVLNERQREARFRAYNRFMKIFDKMLWMLSRLHGDVKLPIDKYFRLMKSLIQHSRFSLTEYPDYGVQIMPRLEVLARPNRVLFVGGMLEGEFPRTSTRDLFFNDELRSRLGLAAVEEFLHRDRLSFYALLSNARQRTIFSYPKYEEERLLIRSTFLDELDELYPGGLSEWKVEETYFRNLMDLYKNLGADIQYGRKESVLQELATLLAVSPGGVDARYDLTRLLVEEQRRRHAEPGIHEGRIDAGLLVGSSDQPDKIWSATQLDDYAFCPMSYLFARYLKLEEMPEIEKGITSLERGLLIHRIFFRFYQWLAEHGDLRRPGDYESQLLKAAAAALDEMPWQGFFARLERQTLLGDANRPGLLREYLQEDQRQIDQTGFVPTYFEMTIGKSARTEKDARSTHQPVQLEEDGAALKLAGSVDRIDVDNNGRLLILDYKTGSGSTKIGASYFSRGSHFQLPLYVLAAQQLLGKEAVFAGYYLIQPGERVRRIPAVVNKDEYPFLRGHKNVKLPNKIIVDAGGEPLDFAALTRYGLAQALQRISELNEGWLIHSLYPDEAQCKQYCDFRRMCRKNKSKQKYLHDQRQPRKGEG